MNIVATICLIAGTIISVGVNAQLAKQDGFPSVSDGVLFGFGNYWDLEYKSEMPAASLSRRPPNESESLVIQRVEALFNSSSAKAMALIKSGEVVWSEFKAPAGPGRLLNSMSIGKTVTAMAAGKAICAGKISLNSQVKEFVPELGHTDLGVATVRHLLTMSSGTWEGNPDSTVIASEQFSDMYVNGSISWLDVLSSKRVNTVHARFFGNKRQPGEYFAYRSTDPLTLGIVIARATGVDFSEWVAREVLRPAAIQGPAKLARDRKEKFGQADSGVRMLLDDWIRFALWVVESGKQQDCFGAFVRDASVKQIPNRAQKFGGSFDGYGYFIWTDNSYAPGSYWAIGYGGQRIGWSKDGKTIMIAFSNVENYMLDLYRVFDSWSKLP